MINQDKEQGIGAQEEFARGYAERHNERLDVRDLVSVATKCTNNAYHGDESI